MTLELNTHINVNGGPYKINRGYLAKPQEMTSKYGYNTIMFEQDLQEQYHSFNKHSLKCYSGINGTVIAHPLNPNTLTDASSDTFFMFKGLVRHNPQSRGRHVVNFIKRTLHIPH